MLFVLVRAEFGLVARRSLSRILISIVISLPMGIISLRHFGWMKVFVLQLWQQRVYLDCSLYFVVGRLFSLIFTFKSVVAFRHSRVNRETPTQPSSATHTYAGFPKPPKTTTASGNTLVELLTSRGNWAYTFLALVRTGMLVLLVLYLNPFASASFSNAVFKFFLFAGMASIFVQLGLNHGRPKFDQKYAAFLFADPLAQQFFFAFIFTRWSPRCRLALPAPRYGFTTSSPPLRPPCGSTITVPFPVRVLPSALSPIVISLTHTHTLHPPPLLPNISTARALCFWQRCPCF